MEYQRLFKQVQAIKAKILDCDRDGISASGEVREAFLIVRSHYHAQFKLLDALLVEEVQALFDKKRAQENVDTEYTNARPPSRYEDRTPQPPQGSHQAHQPNEVG
jgi:hypothetical protein